MFNEKELIAKWNADMYDLHETETEDVDFALSVIGPAPKNILEIACGSGRFLVPLARAGHTVTGLDFDQYMLDKIGPKAAGLDNISWRRADVIRESWGAGFDVVLIAANLLFNIISDMDYEKAQRLLLEKASKALSPGGSVYIDYACTRRPEAWFNDPGEKIVWEGADSAGNTGRMVLSGSTFDCGSNIVRFTRRFELTLADGGRIVEEIPSVKHYPPLRQVRGWLSENGFSVRKEYGDYSRRPIGEDTDRAVIWAQKP